MSVQIPCHFKIGLFVFLLLSYMGSLCSLDTRLIRYFDLQIFSHYLSCTFTFLTVDEFYSFILTFRSVIHFVLICVYSMR